MRLRTAIPVSSRTRSAVVGVMCAAGVLGLLGGLAACTTAPKSLTSPGATPRQVLDAYLLALQAGDCATSNAYAVDQFLSDGELCGRVNVEGYRADTYQSHPSPDRVVLAATLTLRGGDDSLRDGDHLWFYTLRRQPSGAWRLSAAGSGP